VWWPDRPAVSPARARDFECLLAIGTLRLVQRHVSLGVQAHEQARREQFVSDGSAPAPGVRGRWGSSVRSVMCRWGGRRPGRVGGSTQVCVRRLGGVPGRGGDRVAWRPGWVRTGQDRPAVGDDIVPTAGRGDQRGERGVVQLVVCAAGWVQSVFARGSRPVGVVSRSASTQRPARDTGGNVQPLAMPATAGAWPTTMPNASRSSSAPNERWRRGAAAVLTVSDRTATAAILTRASQRAAG
jgi:hypothetical protein